MILRVRNKTLSFGITDESRDNEFSGPGIHKLPSASYS